MTHSASLRHAQTAAPSEVAPGLVDRTPAVELRTLEGEREWLLTNARGTFALGAVDRVLRRKYHSILTTGSGGHAQNLLAEVIERVTVGENEYALLAIGRDAETASKRPELQSFSCRDSAVWVYEFGSVRLRRELILDPDSDCIMLRYELSGGDAVELSLEPLLLFRSGHSVAQKSLFLDGRVREEAGGLSMAPYRGSPNLRLSLTGSRARFGIGGAFRELVHEWEGDRGYERGEFAFSPGSFTARLTPGEPVVLRLGTELSQGPRFLVTEDPPSGVRSGSFRAILERSLQSFLVQSANGPVIVAGYPWLGESVRQTLLALPALLPRPALFFGALEAAGRAIANGPTTLLPAPGSVTGSTVDESVDAPLLFIRAVELAVLAGHGSRAVGLVEIAESILRGWIDGSHPRVKLSTEGLLFVTPGPWALTWMNAKVDGLPVTARSGFAVDVNALFVDALAFLSRQGATTGQRPRVEPWSSLHERAAAAFRRLFWSDTYGHLADCHDGTTADFSLRPNQLWAAALPTSPLSRAERLSVVDAVRDHLLTEVGVRTLSPKDPRYAPRCEGDAKSRDSAAHQGSAWPFLLGLYADALAELGETERLRDDLRPVLARLERHVRSEGCVGQLSELFDGESPHEPRGAPAHAASVAEVLRVLRMVEQ